MEPDAIRNLPYHLICLLLIGSLVACGFTLRGTQRTTTLPTIQVTTGNLSSPFDPFVQRLQASLQALGPPSTHTQPVTPAQVMLKILEQQQSLQSLPITAENLITAKTLYYQVTWQLFTLDGKSISSLQTSRLQFQFVQQTDQPNDVNPIKHAITDRMQIEMIQQILSRLYYCLPQ